MGSIPGWNGVVFSDTMFLSGQAVRIIWACIVCQVLVIIRESPVPAEILDLKIF